MLKFYYFFFLSVVLRLFCVEPVVCQYNESTADLYLQNLAEQYSYECNLEMVARWAYITDVQNTELEDQANDASVRYLAFQGQAAVNISENFDYENFTDVDLYRQSRFQADQGPGGLAEDDLIEYKNVQSSMETTYSTATICVYEERDDPECTRIPLEPDIENILATSTDWDELTYVWDSWRDVTGKLMRQDFIRFVQLSNEAATIDGYNDTGDYWLNGYTVTEQEVRGYGNELHQIDQDQFQANAAAVWNQVSEALYKKLHAYVRMKLQDVYGDRISLTGPIPANILGNMWAQDWTNIAEYVMPFPDQPTFDVTDSMIEQDWDIDQMFNAAEDFFVTIGLFEMTETFWEKSVINQTDWGKTIVCHASAEDFCLGANSTDFRIKMCTQVNMDDLVTVHHEMGHIEYFMAYRDLPHVYRTSANPGFHEAIGDLIALSVSTPAHMEQVLNLTATLPPPSNGTAPPSNYTIAQQRDLNFLMRMALEKVSFLPFGYLIDKYRWSVYDGSISSDDLNAGWWDLRESLQGVTPPNGPRGEQNFDPGAKYHVPANVPYIRYFVSFIVQFQFHKHLCKVAGDDGPLYECDIYNNTDAGGTLMKSLEDGFSRPWPLVLKDLGDSFEMDASAIIEYFQPLMDYLDGELKDQCIGWGDDCFTESQLADDLESMDKNLTYFAIDTIQASWTYNTDATSENADASSEAAEAFSSMYNLWWLDVIEGVDSTLVTDPLLRRQLELQKSIGTAILDSEDFSSLSKLVNNMTDAFNNKICPYTNQTCKPDSDLEALSIDQLELKMANMSLEYAEHLYYWTEWREVSGKEVLKSYPDYVTLENKAAHLNGFPDAGIMWLDPYTSKNYTTDDFKAEIEDIWNEVKSFYQDLHAYVRYKLKQDPKYTNHIKNDGLIPANILGNMWAQSWENLYSIVEPYPDAGLTDLTPVLEEKIDNSREMFKIAEDFFTSMGLYSMTPDFFNNSMFDQPPDKIVVCHASAWDWMSTQWMDATDPREDGRFRIKMCTDKNQEDFIVIHHEMGHIEYQMSYSVDEAAADLRMPMIFRDGANPGFHEAIGDTIALSVSTPNHLAMIEQYLNNKTPRRNRKVMFDKVQKEKLTKDEQDEKDINFLMKQALAKVAFLPFAYILDQWRWDVFDETVDKSVYNRAWWEKRIDYQGIAPPNKRDESADFDIGSKYHVPTSVPYIRYFVAHVLQFQFHEKLCQVAGYDSDEPIYNCDIYNSTDAGTHLYDMLKKGASEGWQQQLGEFLEVEGEGKMDISSMLSYFEPLRAYITKFNNDTGIQPGWSESSEVIDVYINGDDDDGDDPDVSALVPIIVGAVLAIMIMIVVGAYIVGQKRRKKKDALEKIALGTTNKGAELEDISGDT